MPPLFVTATQKECPQKQREDPGEKRIQKGFYLSIVNFLVSTKFGA